MAHRYHKLQHHDSIRLLKLYTAATASDTLHFELEEHRLDDVPTYEAISYVWGNVFGRDSVLCGNAILSIGQNLAAALRRLRRQDGSRLLWADAVCINQDDVAERNEQVRIMRHIYELASGVLVWLGAGDETVLAAIHLINHIFDTASAHWSRSHEGEVVFYDVDDFADFPPQATFPPPDSDEWSPLVKFFSRQWFQRTWIIQEVAVAKEVALLCGDPQISWSRVGVAASWIQRQLVKSDFGQYQAFEHSNVYKAMVLYDKAYTEDQDFLGLLAQYRDFSATNRKDKVFAPLGLPRFLALPRPIQPDYNKSELDVGIDVVKTPLTHHNDLSILSFVHHIGSIRDDWPTFVPHWDTDATASSLLSRTEGFENYASGGAKLDEHGFELKEGQLIIYGLVLSSIHVFGDLMNANHFNVAAGTGEMEGNPVRAFWEDHLNAFRDYRQDKIADVQVIRLCQTMTAATNSDYNKTDRRSDDDGSPLAKDLADYAAYLQRFDPDSTALQSISQDLNDEDGYDGNPTNFGIAASRVCDDRRLFLYGDDYIGVGPNVMQPRDQLCILFGGQQLYVLRPKAGLYQLVGECFVEGLMWGEGLQAYENGEQEVQEFCLC